MTRSPRIDELALRILRERMNCILKGITPEGPADTRGNPASGNDSRVGVSPAHQPADAAAYSNEERV